MTIFSLLYRRFPITLLRTVVLITISLFGVFLGVQCFFSSQYLFISLMRRSISCSVSIVGLLGAFIPLLICLVYPDSFILCSALFTKSFSYAVTVMSCYHAFGRGSWFVCFLLLIASHVSVLLQIWISLRLFIRQETVGLRFCCLIFAIMLLTVCIVLCIIQPYLTAVFSR